MKLSHFFLPHPQTHKKAHLISISGLSAYLLFFIVLQFIFSFISNISPGVLGVAANIQQQEVIRLTNIERQKNGLPLVIENSQLNKAALEKAKNMFAENYWAHYAPSGKSPWDFINSSGYKFTYAGENLARNFQNSDDVVQAWMDSPTHKANILNSHYQEIGIAVLNGTLKGEQTTIVVQEFGRPTQALASLPEPNTTSQSPLILPQSAVAGEQQEKVNNLLIDPFSVTKNLGLLIIGLVLSLTLIDIYIMRKRAVARVGVRSVPTLGLLSVAAITLINMKPGVIL